MNFQMQCSKLSDASVIGENVWDVQGPRVLPRTQKLIIGK